MNFTLNNEYIVKKIGKNTLIVIETKIFGEIKFVLV